MINAPSAISSDFDLFEDYFSDSDTDESMPALGPVSDSDDEIEPNAFVAPFPQARAAEQIVAEAFLQHGQPYSGDNHVQEKRCFLVYQTSDMEHIIIDNMIDEDVLIPTQFLCDHNFDMVCMPSPPCIGPSRGG